MCISPQLKINSSKQNCKSQGKVRSRSSRGWRPLKTGTPCWPSSGWGPPVRLRPPTHTCPWAAPSTHPTPTPLAEEASWYAHLPRVLSLSLDCTVPVRWGLPKQDIRPWEMCPGQQKSLAWSRHRHLPLSSSTPQVWRAADCLSKAGRGGGRWCSLWSENHSVFSDSLRPNGLYSPWDSPGQNTRVGSLSLLQGIFPTQGSNPGLPHCRLSLYQLSHKGCSLVETQMSESHTEECWKKWTTATHLLSALPCPPWTRTQKACRYRRQTQTRPREAIWTNRRAQRQTRKRIEFNDIYPGNG